MFWFWGGGIVVQWLTSSSSEIILYNNWQLPALLAKQESSIKVMILIVIGLLFYVNKSRLDQGLLFKREGFKGYAIEIQAQRVCMCVYIVVDTRTDRWLDRVK